MKIVCISDTHGQRWNLKIHECDLFIFTGDANINSLISLHDFNDWLGTLKVKYGRLVIAGNHDLELEKM